MIPEEGELLASEEETSTPTQTNVLPEPNDEPVTNPLLLPTMPDLSDMTNRRSQRQPKKVKRYGFVTKALLSAFVVCSTILGVSATTIQDPAPLLQRVCLHTERINTHIDGTINKLHHACCLTINASDNDTYTLKQMLQQDDKNDFIEAMIKEVDDHSNKGHWDVVKRTEMPPDTKTILVVWAFKR